jgi:RNA polymerase sigma factor (sigma-70 family)
MSAALEKKALERRQVLDCDTLFEILYRRYEGDVYRLARRLVGRREDAEDVTQIAFLNAYRALSRGKPPRKPRPWLLAIARNVCAGRFRAQQSRPREVVLDPDIVEARPALDGAVVEEFRAALERLSFAYRSVIVLREFKAWSYADIAATLGLSVPAVETLLFRARRALRHELEKAEIMPSVCATDGRKRRALGGLVPLPAWLGKPLSWFGSLERSGLSWNAAGVTAAAVIATGAVVGTGVLPLGPSVTEDSPSAPAGSALPATVWSATIRTSPQPSVPKALGSSASEPVTPQAPSSQGRVLPEPRTVTGSSTMPSPDPSSSEASNLPAAPLPEPPALEPPALPEPPALEPPSLPGPVLDPPSLPAPPLPEPPELEPPGLPAPLPPPPPALPLP